MDMKQTIYMILAAAALAVSASCVKLDLTSPTQASSENWYANVQQIDISLNDSYRTAFWGIESEYWTDRRTDDWAQRDQVYDLCNGATTSATSTYNTYWTNTYKAISRSIRILEAIRDKHNDSDAFAAQKAEAYFFLAYMYARMATYWGDAPFYEKSITIDEAKTMRRTGKDTLATKVYEYYDKAIEGLPEVNNGRGLYRANKYAAMALKARFALYRASTAARENRDGKADFRMCADLCKKIKDSENYSLYYSTENAADSYGELFRQKNYNSEFMFLISTSIGLEEGATAENIKSWVLRTAGGNAVAQPSWDLLAAYEMNDGKTIDEEGSKFNCHDPYANRDPRCCMTFAAPGTKVFDVVFDPNPNATQVMDYQSGKMVKNKDTKANDNYAPYNGCCIRKGEQPEWRSVLLNENPWIIMRYADVLLMYAEAKMELNEIDGSVLDAINSIRARAYGVTLDETDKYPAITTGVQKDLRKIIRRERRVELAWEGRRLDDLRRWGLLEKCYSTHYYGLLNASGLKGYVADGNWFWPSTPKLDEDGFADFSPWEAAGLITKYGHHVYDSKVELFPVPDDELKVDPYLGQNPGY